MTVSMFFRSAAAAALAVGTLAMPAGAATLIGDSITAAYYFPNQASVYGGFGVSPTATFTVGAGIEATGTVDGSLQQTFDFAASSLTLTYNNVASWTATDFNGWGFTNNSKAYDAITSVTGIDPARVTITGNTLFVNWQGLSYAAGNQIVVNFGAGAIPEPASWMMLIGGFGMVGAAMRRRRVASVA